jgi:thioredoxin-related protein
VIDQITSIFLQLYCTSNYMKTDTYLVFFIFKRESRSEKIQMRCITESHCTYQDALKKEKKKKRKLLPTIMISHNPHS